METAIDVGNTNVKIGFFEGGKLHQILRFPTQPISNIYRQLSGYSFRHCILSSVVPLPEHILHYLKGKSKKLYILDAETPLPIRLSYDTPQTLGRDRIALAVAASGLYPNENVLIMNAGSCITYNLLTKDKKFLGGAISPGLHMRLRAMHEFTGALPLAEPSEKRPPLIGKSTDASLLSGAVNGLIFEMEGYVKETQKEYSPLKLLLSGGDSRYLEQMLSLPLHTEPELGLYGLYKILELNVKKAS